MNLMNNLSNKIDIEKGTISFWIKENQIKFDNNQLLSFININKPKGSIFILKDADNKIKFFYVYLEKGRTDIEWDCSHLVSNKKHMIATTWSQENKEINLYIDGQLVETTKIKY